MTDTICAIATATGKGGVAIVRLSGPDALRIVKGLTKRVHFKPRYAHFARFVNQDDVLIDEGLALYFPAPHSFTGEDVVELHGHGGVHLPHALLNACVAKGARLANAGEFSYRAFDNNKLDLTQAEAICDAISATHAQAAQSAIRSLSGAFSQAVNALVDEVVALRVFVEAAIDFSDEADVDFLADEGLLQRIARAQSQINAIHKKAHNGRLLKDGIHCVLLGPPNAGKSSLLNALSGQDEAIVTEIAGTTRDIIKADVVLDGLPVRLMDTAGIRDTQDAIEHEGICRAKDAAQNADLVLVLYDLQHQADVDAIYEGIEMDTPRILVGNKVDLVECVEEPDLDAPFVAISAKTGIGLDALVMRIFDTVHYNPDAGALNARMRHLHALENAKEALETAKETLEAGYGGELLAEHLRLCARHLGQITGEYLPDDLLGDIFSSFCIGK